MLLIYYRNWNWWGFGLCSHFEACGCWQITLHVDPFQLIARHQHTTP